MWYILKYKRQLQLFLLKSEAGTGCADLQSICLFLGLLLDLLSNQFCLTVQTWQLDQTHAVLSLPTTQMCNKQF